MRGQSVSLFEPAHQFAVNISGIRYFNPVMEPVFRNLFLFYYPGTLERRRGYYIQNEIGLPGMHSRECRPAFKMKRRLLFLDNEFTGFF